MNADALALAAAGARGQRRAMPATIRTSDDVRALFAHLVDQPCEICAFAFLDAEGRVLGMRHAPAGGTHNTELPLRAVARDAVAFEATRVVMAHNHPSGDPTPSKADIRVTRQLARALAALGAPLVEHLVLARSGWTSLRAAGVV